MKNVCITRFYYINRDKFHGDQFTCDKLATAESHIRWHMTLNPIIGAKTAALIHFAEFATSPHAKYHVALLANAKMIVCNHPTAAEPLIHKGNQVKISVALEDVILAMVDLMVLLVNVFCYHKKDTELQASQTTDPMFVEGLVQF